MASISPPTPHFNNCYAFCATDFVLGPTLAFYRPYTGEEDGCPYIEAHVLSQAGFQSYPKLAFDSSSPLYTVVYHLPTVKQQSEVYRALAIALLKYFSDLAKPVKEAILKSKSNAAPAGQGQAVAFDEMHAGDLAARLLELQSDTLAEDLRSALTERFVSSIDVDVVLRTNNGQEVSPDELPENVERFIENLGEPTNLTFGKLKRSASKAANPRPKEKTDELIERELEELRQTEENYVAKIQQLMDEVVKPLKARAASKQGDLWQLTKEIDALFPACLSRIAELNQAFLEDIKTGDIEAVASACQTRFPDFKQPYQEYLRANADFPQLIARLQNKDKNGSFTRKLQQTGEQKLRSLIIEPVQRLPRYSLLIDNIIDLLPKDHPSLVALNNARDVISEICNLQTSSKDERSNSTRRLQSIIITWPMTLRPKGRLIAAFDALEIFPPYNNNTSDDSSSIILLFPDCVVFLRRPKSTSLMARGIMAEVDRQGGSGSQGSLSKRDNSGHDLVFGGWIDLADVKVASSDAGSTLWMVLNSPLRDAMETRPPVPIMRKFHLMNQYEGRSMKVEAEFAKARVERRIGGATKGIIGLREIRHDGMTIWSCVWNDRQRYMEQKHKGTVLVYMDIERGVAPGKELMDELGGGVEVAMSVENRVNTAGTAQLRLETRSMNEYSSQDTNFSAEQFVPVFHTRICKMLRRHCNVSHPPLTDTLLAANQKLLSALGIMFDGESSRLSKLRPTSPAKMLSFLSTPGSPTKGRVLHERTQSQILTPNVFRAGLAQEEEPADNQTQHRILMADSPLRKLEQVFEALMDYISNIGNDDGDFLPIHDMSTVDHASADKLIRKLFKDPTVETIEGTGLDVVFTAFYEFMQKDWTDGMGALINAKALKELQHKSDTFYPTDFEDFFRLFLLEWTPQNKRAFKAIISLLKELHARVARGDSRGALTKCFAEILVGDNGNPLDYMGLVDRLVEDMDLLFKEAAPVEDAMTNGRNKMRRAKSVQTPSSSTASLRRRFGLTHSSSVRESPLGRSMDIGDSKAHSLWRTLSKRDNDDEKKGHLARSRSIDYDAAAKRPPSRDRPALMGSALIEPYVPDRQPPPRSTTPAPLVISGPKTPRRKRRSSLSDLTSHPEFMMFDPGPPLSPLPSTPKLEQRESNEKITPVRSYSPAVSENTPVRSYSPAISEKHTPIRTYSPAFPDPIKPSPSPVYERQSMDRQSMDRQSMIPVLTPTIPNKLTPTKRDLPKPLQIHKKFAQSSTNQRLVLASPKKLRERLNTDKSHLRSSSTDSLNTASISLDESFLSEMAKIGQELNGAMSKSTNTALQSKFENLGGRVQHLEARMREYEETLARHVAKLEANNNRLTDEIAYKDAALATERESRLEAEASLQASAVAQAQAEAARQRVEAKLELEVFARERAEDARRKAELALWDEEAAKRQAEGERQHAEAALIRRNAELKSVDKHLKDCAKENDVIFDHFNKELSKMAAGFKAGKAEVELVRLMGELKAQHGDVKKENQSLKRENLALRSGSGSHSSRR